MLILPFFLKLALTPLARIPVQVAYLRGARRVWEWYREGKVAKTGAALSWPSKRATLWQVEG